MTRNTTVGELLVTTFSTEDFAIPMSGGYETPNETPCYEGYKYNEVTDTLTLWTPILIVGAPYDGGATAMSSFTQTWTRYIMARGWTSTLASGQIINAEFGETKGIFQLVQWGKIRMHYQLSNCAWAYYWTAAIIDDMPLGHVKHDSFDLTGPDSNGGLRYMTAADDLTQVSQDGYGSIKFDVRYRRPPHQVVSTTGGGYSWTTGVDGSAVWRTGIDIGFGSPVSATIGTLEGRKFEGTESTYHYDFAYGGTWNVRWLGTRNSTWAFCYPTYVRC